jgi:hypothetical protein
MNGVFPWCSNSPMKTLWYKDRTVRVSSRRDPQTRQWKVQIELTRTFDINEQFLAHDAAEDFGVTWAKIWIDKRPY